MGDQALTATRLVPLSQVSGLSQALGGRATGVTGLQGIAPNLRHLILGDDSLTAGAGGFAITDTLVPRLRAEYGDGGPGYVGLAGGPIGFVGGTWSHSGTTDLFSDVPTTSPAKYSFFRMGQYTAAGDGTPFVVVDVARNYDTVTVYYLKQPSGGSFRLGQYAADGSTKITSTSVTVSTANAGIALGSVTFTVDKTGHSRLYFDTITGLVCIFGGDFRANTNGIRISMCAAGGQTLASYAALDATMQAAWMTALGGSDTLQNNSTHVLIVAPNQPADEATTNMASYRAVYTAVAAAKGTAYLSHADVLGTYATANAAGLMQDGVHPSQGGFQLLADAELRSMGISPTSKTIAADPFGASGVHREGSLYVFNDNYNRRRYKTSSPTSAQDGTPFSYPGLRDNLIAGWRFEASPWIDSAGNIGNFTAANTPTTAAGKHGNGINLVRASAQYLQCNVVGDQSAMTPVGQQDFTLTAWVNLTSKPATSQLPVFKCSTFVLYYAIPEGGWVLGVTDSSSTIRFAGTGTQATGSYHFIAAWYDSIARIIYIQLDNGTIVSTAITASATPLNLQATVSTCYIGQNGAGQTMDGVIDDLSLWISQPGQGGMLSKSQRTQLYLDGAGKEWPY
jgi:hypothetical protein